MLAIELGNINGSLAIHVLQSSVVTKDKIVERINHIAFYKIETGVKTVLGVGLHSSTVLQQRGYTFLLVIISCIMYGSTCSYPQHPHLLQPQVGVEHTPPKAFKCI